MQLVMVIPRKGFCKSLKLYLLSSFILVVFLDAKNAYTIFDKRDFLRLP